MRDGPGKGYALARSRCATSLPARRPTRFSKRWRARLRGAIPARVLGRATVLDGGWCGRRPYAGIAVGGRRAGSARGRRLRSRCFSRSRASSRGRTWRPLTRSRRDSFRFPTATWRRGDLSLAVTAFGDGDRARAQIVSRYTVANASDRSAKVTLVLALRPFQVNPPAQFLNAPGGVARSHALAWTGSALADRRHAALLSRWKRRPMSSPAPFESGDLAASCWRRRSIRMRARSKDAERFPSAALLRLEIPARGSRTRGVVAPFRAPTLPEANAESLDRRSRARGGAGMAARSSGAWRSACPRQARRSSHTCGPRSRTCSSTRGAGVQPGTRAYARSWIRDGRRVRRAPSHRTRSAVREFAGWYAPHLFASGKVPRCVDARGADPVPENDSHGEWIHLVDNVTTATRTTRRGCGRCGRALRAPRPTWSRCACSARLEATQPMFAGLMPPSISHEGYSDKPAWSYWDDFWALTGYRGARGYRAGARAARGAARSRGMATNSSGDLARSIAASRATTDRLHPRQRRPRRFRRDLHDDRVVARRSSGRHSFRGPGSTLRSSATGASSSDRREARVTKVTWDAYTPYELRNVGASCGSAGASAAHSCSISSWPGSRPAGWNQWAEVVGREAREPRFVGDMPHGWVASDYIRSVLDLFAYEREDGARWCSPRACRSNGWTGTGVAIERLRRDGATSLIRCAAKRRGSCWCLRRAMRRRREDSGWRGRSMRLPPAGA